MNITTQLIQTVAPRCTNPELVAEKLNLLLPKLGIDTPIRIVHFMAQIAHESEFNPVSENLNYSARRLTQVFPRYFPTLSLATQYAGNPIAIASRVYGGRMGNGPESTGEGFAYRGRGMIQLTGKNNYKYYGGLIGYDLIEDPDLALQYGIGILIAGTFFKNNGCIALADKNDLQSITRRINGGLNGYEDRRARFNAGWTYYQNNQ